MLRSNLKTFMTRLREHARAHHCKICGHKALRPYREFGRLLKARAIGVEATLHACSHCTHKQFLPELSAEQLAPVYAGMFETPSERESYAAHYQRALSPYKGFAERIVQLAKELGLPASARVHEFGCGAGITVRHLRAAGFEATGSDWSVSAIAFAREQGNEHVFLEDMNTPQVLKDADILLALHVIEHVPDPVSTVAHFVTMLGPRSIIVLLTNQGDGIVNREHGMLFDSWFYFPQHIHYFSARSFKALAESAGCKVLRLGTTRRTFPQVEAALGPLEPQKTHEQRLDEVTRQFGNQELEMVLARATSPLEAPSITLPGPARADSRTIADWDSHEDFFIAESPWRRLIIDQRDYTPIREMVFSVVHNYWYWDMAFVGDHWLAHYDREPLPMVAFKAPRRGLHRITLTTGVRSENEPACQFIIMRPDARPTVFAVNHLPSRRRDYEVMMRKDELFGVAIRAAGTPNSQKAICLISIRRA
jgi:SAM-dependent methyltransferase